MFHQINRSSRPLWAILTGASFTLILFLLFLLPTQVQAETYIYGPITSNTTWNIAGSPYIITGTVQVLNGVTLTINPGVTVKMENDTSLQINGTLIADGCTITSNQPSPAAGDWGGVLFNINSTDAVVDDNGSNYVNGSKIKNCTIEFGGSGVNGVIETISAPPFLDQNLIQDNGASGIHATGRSAANPIIITRNAIQYNTTDSDGDADGGASLDVSLRHK
jgi:hypothetical protein